MSYVSTELVMMLASIALEDSDRLVFRPLAGATTEVPAVVLEVRLLTTV